jgi:hypothetical protein
VLPGKASKQNCDPVTLLGLERPFHRSMEMCGLVETGNLAQSPALGLQTLFDFFIVIDLHEISRHYLPPAYAVLVNFGLETLKTETLK